MERAIRQAAALRARRGYRDQRAGHPPQRRGLAVHLGPVRPDLAAGRADAVGRHRRGRSTTTRWRKRPSACTRPKRIRAWPFWRPGADPDLEQITSAWVYWDNTARLMHRLGRRPPAEAEALYYQQARDAA